MASGSQNMTTYYAKRIVGDASAAQADSALLQTGANVTADTWILNRTNRADAYGIKYVYDDTDGHDKIELYGGSATASAWVQLDTGNITAPKFIGALEGNADTATALTSNAGGTEQPIYFTGGKPAATSYALKATVNNGTEAYLAYYSGERAISSWSAAKFHDGCLSLFPTSSNYREGLRIHAVSNWSDITLCGTDNTGDTGISANSWFIGNNNGNFYIARNGSPGNTAWLECVNNIWSIMNPLWIKGGSTEAGADANRLTTSAGTPGNMQYNTSRRGTQIYSNGIAFADPYNGNSNNDAGWIRHLETSANSAEFEIAVGDDGNEPIYVRQYNTSNAVARQIALLTASGNTTIPGSFYFGGDGIYHSGTAATQRIIRIIDSEDQYGTGISIGAGGLALFGSGESTSTAISNLSLTAGGTETTYVTSDDSIEFYPSINKWDATARIWMTAGVLNIGLDGNSPRENSLNVYGGAGRIQLYSASSTTGNRGLWVPAHGSGSAKNIILVDTNNNITFNGDVTGNAATASKLGTATVGGANRGIYLNGGTATAVSWYYDWCTISGGNKANYPWHRFATCTTGAGQWTDKTVIIVLHSRYDGGPYGMVKLSMRTNASGGAKSTSAVWIYRKGFAVDDIKISAPAKTTGTDETINAYIKCGTYPRRIAYILEGSNIGWSLVASNEPDNTTTSDKKGGTEINASVSGNNATDGATVSYANSAGSSASCTGNAATATRINGNLAAATSDANRNIWVSSGAGADGIPNYISYFNMNPSTNVFSVPAGTRISPNTGALYLGNSGNQNWVYVQDMCGQDGQKWKIHQNGNAEFTGTVTATKFSGPLTGNVTGNCSGSSGSCTGNAAGLTGGLVTNTVTSHGNLAVTTAKGSYYGINLGHNASGMTIMSINASHQGLYNQTNGQWILYYNAASSSKSIVIGNSTVNITGGISLNLNTKITGSLEMTGNQTITGAGAHWTKWVNTTTGVSIEMWSDTTNQGIYTRGYWTGSAYTASAGWILYRGTDSYLHTQFRLYGAVWNDYAEFRKGDVTTPGRVVIEQQNGIMTLCNERLAAGAKIISDTYGFAIGETKECKTPIAVSGRVLVYPYRNRNEYELGAAVCSAPRGTIDIMTREEIKEYPERIIGTVSEIPEYEIWHCNGNAEQGLSDEVKVDGRIWIYVR